MQYSYYCLLPTYMFYNLGQITLPNSLTVGSGFNRCVALSNRTRSLLVTRSIDIIVTCHTVFRLLPTGRTIPPIDHAVVRALLNSVVYAPVCRTRSTTLTFSECLSGRAHSQTAAKRYQLRTLKRISKHKST